MRNICSRLKPLAGVCKLSATSQLRDQILLHLNLPGVQRCVGGRRAGCQRKWSSSMGRRSSCGLCPALSTVGCRLAQLTRARCAELYEREVEGMLEEVERQYGTQEFVGVHARVEADWEHQCRAAQNRTDPSTMLFNNRHQCWVSRLTSSGCEGPAAAQAALLASPAWPELQDSPAQAKGLAAGPCKL